MKKIFFITGLLLLCTITILAQTDLKTVLSEVEKNNKTLLADKHEIEALKLQFKVGNSLNDPTVSYDYMIGTPATAGNQTDIVFAQSFDFPLAYVKRKNLAEQRIAQTEFMLKASRVEVLQETKLTCLELIYCNKLAAELARQQKDTQQLLADFETKMQNGEGNILDVNKAKLQLLDINKMVEENQSAILQLTDHLTELNGGQPVAFASSEFPPDESIASFEQLEQEIEAVDPDLKLLQQQQTISSTEIELNKALWLPKFELGYHYQGILGQRFSGVHAAASIPLWQNKNTVKQKQAEGFAVEQKLAEHLNEHYFEIKHLYQQFEADKNVLEQYQSTLSQMNGNNLLKKALDFGEISTTQYFLEMSYYNNAMINMHQAEWKYKTSEAELVKHKL